MHNGVFETRNIGGSHPNRLRFEWWLAEQDIAGNRSRIGFKLFGTGGATNGSWIKLFKATLTVAGQTWNAGGCNLYNGTIVLQGDKWINHNGDGTGWFEASSNGAIYQAGYNSFGQSSWGLPTIPRASQPSIKTAPHNTPDFNLGEYITIHMNPVNGSFRHNVYFLYANKSHTIATNVAYNCTFNTSDVAEEIYKITGFAKAYSGQIKVDTFLNGNLTGSKTCHYNAHVANANPRFVDFDYFDSNPATSKLAGNSQMFIQGQSKLSIKIPISKKAEAVKHATMRQYLASSFGVSLTKNYQDSDLQIDLGTVNVSTNQILSVSAIDSREFSTSVVKNIIVIPYESPRLVVSAVRRGNFESETKIKISGNIASIKINNAEKNSVKTLRYRIKAKNESSYGEWRNVSFTVNQNNLVVNDFYVALDNTKQYVIEFEFTDQLTTQKAYTNVDVGIPIFRISTKTKKVYNNEKRILTEEDKIDSKHLNIPFIHSSDKQSYKVRIGELLILGGRSSTFIPAGEKQFGNKIINFEEEFEFPPFVQLTNADIGGICGEYSLAFLPSTTELLVEIGHIFYAPQQDAYFWWLAIGKAKAL